ncbi:MAG: class I SAM-dependent methyltransferase [Chloroflexi bacterium]|nr:class I SAM-dependent methyltransferase [Chloroflexota bacterium]
MFAPSNIDSHYSRTDLLERIVTALRAEGKDPERLSPSDLAAIDQFHARGRAATADLARRAGLTAGTCVLDAGGGFGGAGRMLAAEFGCIVTVLDLTADYIRAGEMLTRATGQSATVTFRRGSVLAMPFDAAAFDCVFTQHVTMNIADKARFYAECRRVLRPGGRLALHDVMAGATTPVLFPVPWASGPALSFLEAPETTKGMIERAGFRLVEWVDESALAAEAFRRAAARSETPGPRPAQLLPLVFGPDAPAMAANFARNIAEGRVVVVQAVFEAMPV